MDQLAQTIAFLSEAGSYPHHPDAVLPVETDMAWVFLAGDRVFKLKKPVQFHFLDFTTLAARKHFCKEELRLNRRIAPDTYLQVLPICRGPADALSFGSGGEVIDYCIEMKRLPAERMLDRCIADARVTPSQVEAATDVMIDFYRGSCPVVGDGHLYIEHIHEELAVSRRILLDTRLGFADSRTAGLVDAVAREVEAIVPEIESRIAAGLILEGHGDLRPEHVCLTSPPVIFDCLEFDRRMRIIDPYDELNYLGLECEVLGAPWVRHLILRRAEARLGSPPSERYIRVLSAFRGVLRAQISLAHLLDKPSRETEDWREHARLYLSFVERELSRVPLRVSS